ncbi:HDOD domain-containing protein [Rhodoferax sp.]|uniref:HDOD domain-containing protein n=1 Tax=Rhodoferax sp. TaxID=50421 RepID=UPI00374D8E57
MTSFFQRVRSKVLGSTPEPATPAASGPASQSPVVSNAAPVRAAPPARPAVAVLAARRPLMASNGEVAGFEFRIDDAALRTLAKSGDTVAQAAHVAAVLVSARLVAMGGRTGFARVPAAWLVHAVVPKNESGTLIGVEVDPAQPLEPALQQRVAAAVAQFREVGAKLAWDLAHDLGTTPDFMLVRPAAQQPVAALIETLNARSAALKNMPVIAVDLGSVEDLELALQSGVRLATGSLATPVQALPVKRTAPLAPEVGRLAQLIGQLAAGADTAVIVSAIKGDIGVSVRLLQRMNSATFAHLGGVASIDQAVLMLGRNELQRWLSLMLTQFAGSRKLSSALQEVALWRSRLLELLAIERGESEPGRFFTLGLASMLGLILKLAPAEVVATLSLPPEAAQALLEQTGPWHVYLRTAMQIESQSITEEIAEADGFGSAARVAELSGQAWAWAADNTVHEGSTKAASAS